MTASSEVLERLSQRQQSFLEELLRHRVRFVIVGGFAVILYANPDYDRVLNDLDLFIEASTENLARLAAALRPLGATRLDELTSQARPEVKITWFDAEIFTSMIGFNFAEVDAQASLVSLNGKELRVMAREDLVRAKERAVRAPDRGEKRNVDLRDLAALGITDSSGNG